MKSLYLYFTLGYPDFRTMREFVSVLHSGQVTGVEIGFPSRDPHYDGPVIRRTHSAALKNDPAESEDIFRILGEKKISMYSLTYFSDVENRLGEFLDFLSERNFNGAIIPDTLTDYYGDYRNIISTCTDHGISFIPFFNASTPDRVVEDVCRLTDSWVYFGIQPSTGINVPFDLAEASRRIRSLVGKREIIYGFGIRDNGQIREIMENGGDGIAMGSVLVQYLETGDLGNFISSVQDARGVIDGYA